MFDTIYRKLFTQTLEVTPKKLDVYIDTRKNTLTAEITRSFNQNKIGFYVEKGDETSYYIGVESSKTVPLDDVTYCEVIYRDRVRYRYGEPQTYEPQYIVFTEEQYDELGIESHRISNPNHIVHTEFDDIDVEKQNEGDVCVELLHLSQNTNLNRVILNFEERYQNIALKDIDPTTQNTYDIRTLRPTSPAMVTVPPTFDGYVRVGYTKFDVGNQETPETITVPVPTLLPRKDITNATEEIETDVRQFPVQAYQTQYEPIEKSITIGEDDESTRVSFTTDEFVESGTIIFSTSDNVGKPTIRTGADYDYHTNIDISPLSAPENVGVDIGDENIYTENAYLIQGIPTTTEVVIHFGEMALMEESLRRVTVESGETHIETVDIQYKYPIIKFNNQTATEYVISTEYGNKELSPKGNSIVKADVEKDTIDYTILDPESEQTVVSSGSVEIPNEPQVIEHDVPQ